VVGGQWSVVGSLKMLVGDVNIEGAAFLIEG
jgi:hypothetical protein